MKQSIRLLIVLLSISMFFPVLTDAAKIDTLKSTNYSIKSFAAKDGSTFYVNSGTINDRPLGIYKVSKDLKKWKLVKKGSFQNIGLYLNSIVTFNEDSNKLVRLSFEGELIREYPQVSSSSFLIDKDLVYYNTGESLYQIGINGKGNRHLFSSKGYINEYTVNNGWLYFTTSIPLSNDPYDFNSTMNLSKIKIANPKQVIPLVRNVNNIDSIIISKGYIYSVIHKDEAAIMKGRPLYRMDYSGKQLKRISSADTTSLFIGSKYIYYIENSADYNNKLFSMTLDGKNIKKTGELPGRNLSAEYHDATFYFEVQNLKQQRFSLYKIQQRQ